MKNYKYTLFVALLFLPLSGFADPVIHVCGDHLTSGCQSLETINNNLAGNYILDDDLTLNTGGNYQPIGSESAPFSGIFDGNGHTIRNLSVAKDVSTSDVGLFGHTDGATIKNINLEQVAVVAGIGVGALIGTANNTTIINANAKNALIKAYSNAGGLVGNIYGKNSNIKNCSSSGTIVGRVNSQSLQPYYNETFGGLVGANYSGSTISESFSTATINASDELGGLVGYDDGVLLNCYSTGSVTNTGTAEGAFMGGLVGRLDNKGSISNCYSSGQVVNIDPLPHEMDSVGGLVGYYSEIGDRHVTGSYWDTDASGQIVGVGNDSSWDSFGLVTADMQKQESYQNWDFNEVWKIDAGKSYPYLRGFFK